MKKEILCILCGLAMMGTIIAHPSAKLHLEDEVTVFGGYEDDVNFKELVAFVSAGIDNELPRMFRESIGSVPGNHRILGHGSTLNAAIPKKAWDKLLNKYPDKKDEITAVWSSFARKCTENSEELTGLQEKQANSLASIIYDIHLIGDLETDNTLIEDVLSLKDIVNNFNKDCETLFANKPEYSALSAKQLAKTMSLNLPMQDKATAVMLTLYKLRFGTMLNATWGKTLKMKYSPDALVNSRQTAFESRRKTRDPQTQEVNITQPPNPNSTSAQYWISSTGKIHNSGCRYFNFGKGVLTDKPVGENCGKCGGTGK